MTTFNTRYQYSFLQAQPTYEGEVCPRWRVRFDYPDYVGVIQDLLPGGDPLIIEAVDTPVDNRLLDLARLKYTFQLLCSGEWDPTTLAVKSNREIQVIIEIDLTGIGDSYTAEFLGWVLPIDFEVEHGPFPFLVTVSATDGLKSSDEIAIGNLDSSPLSGNVSITQSLRSGLHKTGYIAPLVTGFNVYEKADMTQGQLPDPAIDPLYQTMVKAETFIGDDGEVSYAFSAMQRVAIPFMSRLTQAKGKWYFVRNDEAGGSKNPFSNTPFTVHTRTYDGIMPSSTSSSHQDENFVLDIGPSGKGRIIRGNPIDLLPQVKKGIRVDQEYGRNINKLPNGDWTNVDSTGLPIGWFRQNISAANSYRAGAGTDIDPFYMVLVGAGDERLRPDTPCIYTDIVLDKNTVEFQRGAERTLKGEFELSDNVDAVKIGIIAYRLGKSYLLLGNENGAGTWEKNVSPDKLNAILTYHVTRVNGNPIVNTGKGEIEIKMEALDKVDRFRIYVCIPEAMEGKDYNNQPGFAKYYGLRLETSGANKDITGTFSRIAPKKIKVDTVATVTLGDVPALGEMAYYKANSLFRRSDMTATEKWYEASDVNLTDGKQLLDLVALSFASDQMQIAWTFEGAILGRFPYAMLTVLRLLDFGEYVTGTVIGPRQLNFFISSNQNYIEVGSVLPWLQVGMGVSISGSVHNNRKFTVTQVNSYPGDAWTFRVAETIVPEGTSNATLTQITFEPYLLQLTRWKFSARMATNEVTAVRIPKSKPADLPDIDYGWKTPNGDVPLGLDQNKLPLNPATQQVVPARTQEIIKALQNGSLGPITAKLKPVFPGLISDPNPTVKGRLIVRDVNSGNVLARIQSRLRLLPFILRLP